MSNLIKHAEYELQKAGLFDDNSDYDGKIGEAVMELMKVFSNQNCSGFSASLIISLFSKLADFKPILPLTGTDDEWVEVSDGIFQNKRCGGVFKDKNEFDGKPYYLDAIVWKDKDGHTYTNSRSRKVIEFPYTPNTEYRNDYNN